MHYIQVYIIIIEVMVKPGKLVREGDNMRSKDEVKYYAQRQESTIMNWDFKKVKWVKWLCLIYNEKMSSKISETVTL